MGSAVKGAFAIGFVSIGLAWGFIKKQDDKKEMDRLISENHLSAEQASAFQACNSQTRKVEVTDPITSKKITPVPKEICLCHSKTMARIFQGGQYDGNKLVIDYVLAKGKGPDPQLNSNDLRVAYRGNKVDTTIQILRSLSSCTQTYFSDEDKRRKSHT